MNSLRWFTVMIVASYSLHLALGSPVEIVPTELRGAVQPQVAVSGQDEVYVAFGRSGSVYCATSLDGGRAFQAPVFVGRLEKLALGMRRGPRVVAGSRGVVISAISHGDGNVVSWSSTDQGRTWSKGTRINSVTNAAREGLHAMAGDGRETVHAAWLDLRNGRTELWSASSKDGGGTWGENRLIYKSPEGSICECCHPSLAVDGRGRVWAMWRNWLNGARDMYASVSEDGAKTFSAARKLGSGTWTLKACPMDGGQLAFAPDGRLLTVWRREKAIFAADDAGERLLSDAGLQPVVSVAGGSVFEIWQQGKQLMSRKDSAEPIVFVTQGAFASIGASRVSAVPVVAWESSIDGAKTIFAQRLE